jgi:hypothetical protein
VAILFPCAYGDNDIVLDYREFGGTKVLRNVRHYLPVDMAACYRRLAFELRRAMEV